MADHKSSSWVSAFSLLTPLNLSCPFKLYEGWETGEPAFSITWIFRCCLMETEEIPQKCPRARDILCKNGMGLRTKSGAKCSCTSGKGSCRKHFNSCEQRCNTVDDCQVSALTSLGNTMFKRSLQACNQRLKWGETVGFFCLGDELKNQERFWFHLNQDMILWDFFSSNAEALQFESSWISVLTINVVLCLKNILFL